MNYYDPHIQIYKVKPKGFSLFMIVAWMIALFIFAFIPNLYDKLVWIPSNNWISGAGPFSSPFIWGTSKNSSILGLIISSGVLWIFGNRLQTRLGKTRFTTYLIMTVGSGLTAQILLTLISYTGPIMVGSNLAVAIAYGIFKTYIDLPLLFKNYLVGNTKYISWVIYSIIGFGLLMNLANSKPISVNLSLIVTILFANWFFDRRYFSHLFLLIKNRGRKRHLWGMRGGKWGMRN